MAKELPYFRFTVQDWQNGKIAIESYELQGLFISICGYYWVQDCSLTLAMLRKKFSNASPNLIDELINLGIIKHEKRHDKVEIVFLNLQYDLLSEKRKSAQDRGSMGGKAKAKLKQKDGYKDKDNNKEKDNNNTNALNISFEDFWNLYDKKVDRKSAESKWKNLTDDEREKSMLHIPNYIKATQDKQYRKNPDTYLNNKSFNDEIIDRNKTLQSNPQTTVKIIV